MRRTRAPQSGTDYSSFEAFTDGCLRDVGLDVGARASYCLLIHENDLPNVPLDTRNFVFVERGDTILIDAVSAAAPATPSVADARRIARSGVSGQAATCLADLSGMQALDHIDVFGSLTRHFMTRLAQARDGFGPVRTDWLTRAEGLGGMVRVSPGGVAIEGIFEDMAPDGGLILRLPDGSRQTIRAGDVHLIGEV